MAEENVLSRVRLVKELVKTIVWYVFALIAIAVVIGGFAGGGTEVIIVGLIFCLIMSFATLWKSYIEKIKSFWSVKGATNKLIQGIFGTIFVTLFYSVIGVFVLLFNIIKRIKPTIDIIKNLRATAPHDEEEDEEIDSSTEDHEKENKTESAETKEKEIEEEQKEEAKIESTETKEEKPIESVFFNEEEIEVVEETKNDEMPAEIEGKEETADEKNEDPIEDEYDLEAYTYDELKKEFDSLEESINTEKKAYVEKQRDLVTYEIISQDEYIKRVNDIDNNVVENASVIFSEFFQKVELSIKIHILQGNYDEAVKLCSFLEEDGQEIKNKLLELTDLLNKEN